MSDRSPLTCGWLGIVIALLGITGSGCQPSPVERPSAAPEVSVATPLMQPVVEWSEFTGRLAATNFVEIRSRVGGYLESIHFTEGQDVRKDTLLFVIDPRPFQAELAKAKASVEEAKAQQIRASAQADRATATMATAASQYELAKADFDRSQALGAALSQAERDLARNEFQKATAALESSRAGIAEAEAEIARAAAVLATAQAAVQTAELNLEYTQIRAPIDGRISRRYVTEGNLIGGGSEQATLLTTIVSLDPIFFLFDASEQQVLRFERRVQAGTRQSVMETRHPAFLGLADEIGFPREGYLDFVDNQFDTSTGTKSIRALFPNTDGLLTPGMFGKLRVAATEEYSAMLLPDESIGADQAEKFVYVVGDDQTVRRQAVETGPLAWGLRVIRRGIRPEDRVVIRGLQRVRPGVVVEPQLATLQPLRSASERDSAAEEQ